MFFTCFPLKSQTIKMDNGLAISSFSSKELKMLNTAIKSYSFMFGIDYINSNIIGLSSQIGYLCKGGKETMGYPVISASDFVEKVDYIHFNTTVRLKYMKFFYCIYIGVGPKIDILLDDNYLKSSIYNDYKLSTISAGLKYEVGFEQYLNNRISVGLNFSYIQNIGKVGGTVYNKLLNDTYLLSFSLGYRLKNH